MYVVRFEYWVIFVNIYIFLFVIFLFLFLKCLILELMVNKKLFVF